MHKSEVIKIRNTSWASSAINTAKLYQDSPRTIALGQIPQNVLAVYKTLYLIS